MILHDAFFGMPLVLLIVDPFDIFILLIKYVGPFINLMLGQSLSVIPVNHELSYLYCG